MADEVCFLMTCLFFQKISLMFSFEPRISMSPLFCPVLTAEAAAREQEQGWHTGVDKGAM